MKWTTPAIDARVNLAAPLDLPSRRLYSRRDGRINVATLHDRKDTLGRQPGRRTIVSDTATASATTEVRPFRFEVTQQEIDELRGAAGEEPDLFSEEVRQAFRQLR
jgi:hypothetical protein